MGVRTTGRASHGEHRVSLSLPPIGKPSSEHTNPFVIDIPEVDLDDLRKRLRTTRWPEDPGNPDYRFGVERGWLEDMVDYWVDAYDWRRHESAMNAYPHYLVERDGVPIHFVLGHAGSHGSSCGPGCIRR